MEFLSPEFFSAVGFPAAICAYTLFGVNKTNRDLTIAINQLTDEVKKNNGEQSKKLEKLEDEIKALKFKVEHWEVRHNGQSFY